MSSFGPDKHFKNFVSNLEDLLAGYTKPDGDFTTHQKNQVENLVNLEIEFRQALVKTNQGREAYKLFVKFIMEEKRNILSARPYFRERQDVFKADISPALRNREDKGLYRFNINYMFIAFVLKNTKFPSNSVPLRLAKEIEKARKELIEVNLPLAISRARIFKKSTPQSYLEYMDLVQASSSGLVNAVDKFCLPYTPVFRAVIIGRATGNLIDSYSQTMLHFNPPDKRKIYRANKARSRGNADISPDDLARRVNSAALDGLDQTNGSEISGLMSAASHVSMDLPSPETTFQSEGESDPGIERYEAPADTRPDVMVEESQFRFALRKAALSLPLFEQKLLRMRGIDL